MKEIIENALSEIEDTLVNAMNSCKDEYEILGAGSWYRVRVERSCR